MVSGMLTLLLLVLTALAAPPTWEQTLEGALPGIVAIRVTTTRAFDTEMPRSSVATGFVVDAERGLILTNRHVVSPAPVIAEAVFSNNEEVPLTPVYRDPIHDFGIFRYDPAQVRFMKPVALPLAPEGARVGVEIRVVGNDAGEKTSILAGTLARLDRDAPSYGIGSYNDFNTFYYQAASSTSGGSSGSPVLDIQGRVIALNAGARKDAASSFFLPLDRVVWALDYIDRGQPVPRGTVQAVFRHRPYDEVRRLGVRAETESAFRADFPASTGMLTVDATVPQGPAWQRLEPGDVLLRVDGRAINGFVPLDAVLDDHVGQELVFDIERGGAPMSVPVRVQDLHTVAPSEYLELSGGVLNPISLQLARAYSVPTGGVVVAASGYALNNAGLGRGSVLLSVGDQQTPDLNALEAALARLPDGARVPVRYTTLANPRLSAVTVLEVDRRWFPLQRCAREDQSGLWPCRPVAAPAEAPSPAEPASFTFPEARGRVARALSRSLVGVSFSVPYQVDGVYGTRFRGSGLIVDAERGLVVVDRDTVPIGIGDLRLTFGGQVETSGRVVYVHPEHNIAIIAYDPASLAGDAPRSARLRDRPLKPGDAVWHVGLDDDQRLVSRHSALSRVESLELGLPAPPTFRETNLDVAVPGDAAPSMGGVLADRRGRVLALWASFVDLSGKDRRGSFYGLPIGLVDDVLDPLIAGQEPVWRTLGVELRPAPLSKARELGLNDAQSAALREHAPQDPRALVVVRVASDSPAKGVLMEGDLVIAVDGRPVTRFRELELAAQQERVPLTVVRMGQTLPLEVPTQALASDALSQALVWSGALLQPVPRAARSQRGAPADGVYVSFTWYGSPAARYGLASTTRILAVDGTPTPDLASFQAAVQGRADRSAVRLRVEDLDGELDLITLKLDLASWPTSALGPEGLRPAP